MVDLKDIRKGMKLRTLTPRLDLPAGAIITVASKNGGYIYADGDDMEEQYDYAASEVEYYSLPKDVLKSQLEKAVKTLESATAEVALIKHKIEYLDETKKKEFIPEEFKKFSIDRIVKDNNMTDEQKTAALSALV